MDDGGTRLSPGCSFVVKVKNGARLGSCWEQVGRARQVLGEEQGQPGLHGSFQATRRAWCCSLLQAFPPQTVKHSFSN